jgi:hypothetical protein
MIPQSYSAWKHCITVQCGIPLTVEYLHRRIAELKSATSYDVQRFRQIYGESHWRKVLMWFEMALKEENIGKMPSFTEK